MGKAIEKRYVFGTATGMWYLVGPDDRDFKHAIPKAKFKELGLLKAKQVYLGATVEWYTLGKDIQIGDHK